MTNKHRERIRARMARTGESYTTAKKNLEAAAPSTSPAASPPRARSSDGLDPYRANRARFRARSLAQWKTLTAALAGGASRVQWTEPLRIIQVLNEIARVAPFNHTHFPDSGGLDLKGARESHEPGCVEVDFGHAVITRPDRLVLDVPANDPLCEWASFWYETGPLAPSGVYDSRDAHDEEVTELYPRHYVMRSHWEDGYYGTDESGDEIPLPKGARVVTRYFRGPFLIVAKGGGWNAHRHLGDYRGNHAKGPHEFYARSVQVLVDELQSRGLYGIDGAD